MAQKQERTRKPVYTDTPTEDARSHTAPVPPTPEQVKKRNAELDALVDEIDEVLVENAEEFVNEYRQKGGQ